MQIAFCGVAYPSLVITYFGQAAFLMANPEQVHSSRLFAHVQGAFSLHLLRGLLLCLR